MGVLVGKFSVPGKPRGKGRHRSVPVMRDGKPVIGAGGRPVVRAYSDDKTILYENLIAMMAIQGRGDRGPTDGPVRLYVWATFAVPASWSKRKREDAFNSVIWPTVKPDLDNIVKAVKDGCNGVLWLDDSQVVYVSASKRYGVEPGLEVEALLA